MVSLIDWLKSDNKASLITVPRMIDRQNIISLLICTWKKYIWQDCNPYCKNHKITVVSNRHFVQNLNVVNYQELKSLNTSINSKGIVIFDDVSAASIFSLLNLEKPRARIIILSGWGDDLENLDTITKTLPRMDLFSLSLVEDVNIKWEFSQTDNLPLQSISDGVIGNWPVKQVVITDSNLDKILSMFEKLSKDKKNPYEPEEIISISSTTQEIDLKLETYNSLSNGILITNPEILITKSSILLKDVSVIHLFGTYSIDNLKMLLEKCYNKNLTINFHGEKMEKGLMDEIKKANKIYGKLVSNAKPLSLLPCTF